MALTVVIVGGGASGALVAAQLLRAADSPLELVLVERHREDGRGVAYGTVDDLHLLNVPAGRMSAIPDIPDDFLDWLRGSAGPGSFVPRRLYGEYLAHVVSAAQRQAAPGVTYRRVVDEVVAIHPGIGGLRVELKVSPTIRAGRVVIAVGNQAPVEPNIAGIGHLAASQYVRDPWAAGALDGVPSRGPILLLGTGLTMVDAVLTLAERGHPGPFHAVSRRGLLPQAHSVTPRPPVAPPSLDTRADLRRLVKTVRRGIAPLDHAGEPGDWRAGIDSLRPVSSELWRKMSDMDRRRFLRHVRPHWDTARHRMPPSVAIRVDNLRISGTLVARAARVLRFEAHGPLVRAELRARGDNERVKVDFAGVVNCTGSGEAYGPASEPFVAQLLRTGQARPGPLGLGLDTDYDGALVGADGVASRLLLTLGPPRKGNLWETTAIPEIRAQAHAIAETVLSDSAWAVRG